jgi:hypothetical protein
VTNFRNALPAERGAIRRFNYPRSILDRLRGRPVLHGWAIVCPWCDWQLAQPETKAGLWGAYRKHKSKAHGG